MTVSSSMLHKSHVMHMNVVMLLSISYNTIQLRIYYNIPPKNHSSAKDGSILISKSHRTIYSSAYQSRFVGTQSQHLSSTFVYVK